MTSAPCLQAFLKQTVTRPPTAAQACLANLEAALRARRAEQEERRQRPLGAQWLIWLWTPPLRRKGAGQGETARTRKTVQTAPPRSEADTTTIRTWWRPTDPAISVPSKTDDTNRDRLTDRLAMAAMGRGVGTTHLEDRNTVDATAHPPPPFA